MNFLRNSFNFLSNAILRPNNQLVNVPSLLNVFRPPNFLFQAATVLTLARLHKIGPRKWKVKKRRPLDGKPFMKGIVLRNVIKKPKKPNSANRKCVLVRLSNGKEKIAYVPGVGHNLQEHNVVLVRVGRVKDCVGVKLKCVRGKYDLTHVVKQHTP